MPGQVTCPLCSQSDQIAKVSTIYIKGVESKHASRKEAFPAVNAIDPQQAAFLKSLTPTEMEALSKRLTPPASRTEAFSRPIHPDQVVLVFSLIAPVFLYGVWQSQPASLWLMLVILAAFYGFYFWRRKGIVERFETRQRNQKSGDARVRQAVERWMRLYYCARDESVFDPRDGESAPVDQIAMLVFKA